MQNEKRLLIAITLALLPFQSFCQKPETKQKLAKDAGFFFEKKNYADALQLYLQLCELNPDEPDYLMKAGICYMHLPGENQKSIEYLEKALKADAKQKDIRYYLGLAYLINYKFDNAAEVFNEERKNKNTEPQREKELKYFLEICRNGKDIYNNPVNVKIENIGMPVNTAWSEYVPVISSDETILIFTYSGFRSTGGKQDEYGQLDPKGRYYEDILISFKIGENWTQPDNIDNTINTPGHDAAIGLSNDGQQLFIYKDAGNESSGDIYSSTLEGNTWSFPVKMNININSTAWEGSASLSPDRKVLYFSSEREGGKGGKDLYKSNLRDDGIWDEAENMGPVINTEYDEDAPFIHPDGKTLFFSSKGHKNMGGYDIFITKLSDNGIWSTPLNIGYPINTTGDDIYFVLSANGERGYFSSGRTGGYGLQDIYVVNLGETADQHALLMIKGKTYTDDKESEVLLEVFYAGDNKLQGIYKSNSSSGNYLLNLPGSSDYFIKYTKEGYPSHKERLNASKTETFIDIVIDVRLYSEGNQPKMNIDGNIMHSDSMIRPEADITLFVLPVQKDNDDSSVGFYRFVNLPALENKIYFNSANDPSLVAFEHEFVIGQNSGKMARLNTLDHIKYAVQVGAFYTPDNFKKNKIKALGKITNFLLKDGITRVTVGSFSTINEAEKIKQQAIKLGVNDAFIVAVYHGERKLISELIYNDFYLK